jgi:ABC-type multidrug transport system fused ATPase/permease subunit
MPGRARRRPRADDLRRTTRLFRRYMGNPKVYLVALVLLVLEALTAVVEPYPIAYLIDYLQGARPSLDKLGLPILVSSERIGTILMLTTAILLIAGINSAADSLSEVYMARGGRSFGYVLRVAMYSHLQRLPLAYHDTKRTGDVLTRVTGDVLVIEDFIVKSVSTIVASLLMLVGSFALILYQSWRVAMVALVVVPMLALVSNHYSKRIKAASKAQRTREGELASTTQEMLGAIRLVQSYGRGTVDLQRFSEQTEQSMHASLRAANIQAQFSFAIAIAEALAISAVVWLGVWLVDRNAITIGTLVLFVLLLQNMFKPARKIVSEWYKVGRVFASVERVDDLMRREVVVHDQPGAVDVESLRGALRFEHVGFAYPAEVVDGSAPTRRTVVLEDVDFDVAPGEVVALVGFSGAGKSTAAQLVPRLYDPDDGAVLVDGHDIRDLTLSSLRRQVSLVLQDTVLLSGSVAENIGYGIADATLDDIQGAARLANAHGFIGALPQGYATMLGERGSTLSGGQRQRIAIARAFIRRAPILILDEPTTGLDAESAVAVVSALRSLMQGRSTILISHDLGLIRCANRILVMSGGRIVEAGGHESLLHSGGIYADLVGHR